ncbi:Hypothetical protein, putative [Bodo saltans]|uniref:R3H-associated N-terminal domain-containing protein n=1 Tax=Bodo saltans TaxID=75058 RepID=A0A0S4ILK0_BODSA|nr:Hypothetical protein, putative [Bodo saltans]|eukprot:CUE71570.1 Hypothetical protein, putative [Bodo saltans]
MSSRGNSPLVSPAMPVPVPLITPRYQRKTRTKNMMTIVSGDAATTLSSVGDDDSSSSTRSPIPSHEEFSAPPEAPPSPPIAANRSSVNEALRQRSEDTLQIKHGKVNYNERVQFHTYEMFRHGSRQVQSRSVGYSSDGDLVLYKDQYAMIVSDSEIAVAGVSIDSAVCLNPAARRPLTDAEADLQPRYVKGSRFKKYPGVRAPKNRKIRNRLMNDHFATEISRKIYDACVDHAGMDRDLEMEDLTRPTFPKLSKQMRDLVVHVDEDKERHELERRGIYATPPLDAAPNPMLIDPNSGEYRFNQLNARLKDELKNALGSEFLTQQIIDLEAYFSEYVTHPPKDDQPMAFQFRDGYGRLVCHGVAAYYNLVSRSQDGACADEKKTTLVSLPKRSAKERRVELPSQSLLVTLQRRQGRSPVLIGAPSPIMPAFNLDDPVVYSEKHVDAALQAKASSSMSATQKKKLRKTMKELANELEKSSAPSIAPKASGGASKQRNGKKAPVASIAVETVENSC